MTVQVVFFKPRGFGSISAPGVGDVRAREAVTIPNTTSGAAQDGESVVIYNGETGGVLVAFGTTPDAVATSATTATSAGFPVAAGQVSPPIVLQTGAKVSIKAIP